MFFDIFDSIVEISKGSAAANNIASTSLSPLVRFDGKFTTLLFSFFI